ncbi:fatty acid-binding protein-like [Glandiceps talaboti]
MGDLPKLVNPASCLSNYYYVELLLFIAMTNLVGTWKLENSENFEAFLDAMEAPAPAKAKALSVQPTMEISKAGSGFHFKVIGPERTQEQAVPVGESFDIVNQVTGGVKKGIASLEGNKLVIKPGAEYPKEPSSSYEVVGGMLVVTLSVGSVCAKRTFASA